MRILIAIYNMCSSFLILPVGVKFPSTWFLSLSLSLFPSTSRLYPPRYLPSQFLMSGCRKEPKKKVDLLSGCRVLR